MQSCQIQCNSQGQRTYLKWHIARGLFGCFIDLLLFTRGELSLDVRFLTAWAVRVICTSSCMEYAVTKLLRATEQINNNFTDRIKWCEQRNQVLQIIIQKKTCKLTDETICLYIYCENKWWKQNAKSNFKSRITDRILFTCRAQYQ